MGDKLKKDERDRPQVGSEPQVASEPQAEPPEVDPSRREVLGRVLKLSAIVAGLFGLGAATQSCYEDYWDWSNWANGGWSNGWSDYPDWTDGWYNGW